MTRGHLDTSHACAGSCVRSSVAATGPPCSRSPPLTPCAVAAAERPRVGRQWWNRDTGYGLCERCAVWLPTRGTTPEEMKELYGERGVHYDLSYGCSAAVSVS